MKFLNMQFSPTYYYCGARGSVVVEALATNLKVAGSRPNEVDFF
jgi:hypothetical protein